MPSDPDSSGADNRPEFIVRSRFDRRRPSGNRFLTPNNILIAAMVVTVIGLFAWAGVIDSEPVSTTEEIAAVPAPCVSPAAGQASAERSAAPQIGGTARPTLSLRMADSVDAATR